MVFFHLILATPGGPSEPLVGQTPRRDFLNINEGDFAEVRPKILSCLFYF